MAKFRDRFFTPKVAQAIMSPLGIVLFGAVTAGGILVGAPFAVAGAVGALAWGAKVAVAVPRGKPGTRIEPSILSEPWRGLVEEARQAKRRFDNVVRDMDSGPTKDRLASFDERLDDGIDESWRIARHGHELTKALRQLDADAIRTDLRERKNDAYRANPTPSEQRIIDSLTSQVAAVDRLQATADDAKARLQLLDARLDELVARAVEVSLGTGDSSLLGDDVDDLVSELEALRVAMEEATAAEQAQLPSSLPLPAPRPTGERRQV